MFEHRWSVLEWIDGTDAWTARHDFGDRSLGPLANDLGHRVRAIGEITTIEVRRRSPGSRGGLLGPLLDSLAVWLHDPTWHAADLIDVAAVERLAEEARELVDEPTIEGLVHGDLIPGNLLRDSGRLAASIHWAT